MGDRGEDSNDDGGDDMFEGMSEPDENLVIDSPLDSEQVGEEISCADMDDCAVDSPSILLSLDANEGAELELSHVETSADIHGEEAELSSCRAAADTRGSCEELEARLGAMLSEDEDGEVSRDEDSATVAMPNDIQSDTATEPLLTDQLASNEGDSEACGEHDEPEVKHQGEIVTESNALEEVASSTGTDQAEPQDDLTLSPTQEKSGALAPEATSGSCEQVDTPLNEILVGVSNYDEGESSEPPPTPLQPSPTVDTCMSGEMTTTAGSGDDKGDRTQTLVPAKIEQAHSDDNKVCSASLKPCHSQHNNDFTATYSVGTVFPVVYELVSSTPCSTSSKLQSDAEKQEHHMSTRTSASAARSTPRAALSTRVEGRHVAKLQHQLEVTERELRGVKKSFKLQLSVLEGEKKTLSSRNARLHAQLASATTDLQRISSELARIRTENELYAAKLPQLQAELLQESTQVDESRSQSLQAQLSIGQLKARAQIIQKRNEALEAANTRLTGKLRESNQELRRKADMIEQQASKIAQLEISIRDERTSRNDEVMVWKHRLTSASQRAQQDLLKAASDWKLKSEKQAVDIKRRADRAARRCRDLEACVSRLEDAAEEHKRELCAHQERIATAGKEVTAMKTVVKRGNQTEAALRNELAAARIRLRDAGRDQRILPVQPSTRACTTRRPQATSIRPRRGDSPDTLDLMNTCDGHRCIKNASPIAKPAMRNAATMTMAKEVEVEAACSQCPVLAQQVRNAHQELTRVRSLHAQELRVQVQAMETVLKAAHCVQSA
jgi:hypothetical protein